MALSAAAMTNADVRTLVRGETADDRAAAAHKLCRTMDRQALSEDERRAAQDILRVMAADAAELVRRALAVTLKSSPLLPRDVALKLAADVESIALPVLNWSPAFTDEDLVQLVRSAPEPKQVAVARRPGLSERVTGALVDVGAEAAVREACANDNAAFSERGLQRAVERFQHSEAVHGAIAHRKVLPISVAERLLALAGDAVRQHLVSHHALSPETALQISTGARERATFDLVEQGARAADLVAFCAHLHRQARLTGSLLLRALASGHMAFFEHGLAELAGAPHHRAWLLVHDAGPLGLKAIYERAGLPARMFQAFRTGVDVFHSTVLEGATLDRERFQERVLQRFLTQAPPASREDIDYLLDKMDRLTAEPRAAESRRGAA
jgi:uncharacterized protein (DUF2336 family)